MDDTETIQVVTVKDGSSIYEEEEQSNPELNLTHVVVTDALEIVSCCGNYSLNPHSVIL